ncbi:HAD family hydrolase [Actinophytocola sp.]|uniref:HAD family hydrolase n=1 Tax=Actinophytocola sp. TaxID=1872138 RepID=UPI0038999788
MDVQQLLASRDLVLLAFDGPVAELPPPAPLADRLRTMVENARMPRNVARTRDPLAVLAYASTIGPATAVAVHAQLSRLEGEVLATAPTAPGVLEAVLAMTAAGTKVAVVGNLVPTAVRSFLVVHGLAEHVWRIAGRGGPDRNVLPPAPDLLTEVIRGRAAESCVFVGGTDADLAAGRAAGLSTYRYRRPTEPESEPPHWFAALAPVRKS